jgi:hypothetical protein
VVTTGLAAVVVVLVSNVILYLNAVVGLVWHQSTCTLLHVQVMLCTCHGPSTAELRSLLHVCANGCAPLDGNLFCAALLCCCYVWRAGML